MLESQHILFHGNKMIKKLLAYLNPKWEFEAYICAEHAYDFRMIICYVDQTGKRRKLRTVKGNSTADVVAKAWKLTGLSLKWHI